MPTKGEVAMKPSKKHAVKKADTNQISQLERDLTEIAEFEDQRLREISLLLNMMNQDRHNTQFYFRSLPACNTGM